MWIKLIKATLVCKLLAALLDKQTQVLYHSRSFICSHSFTDWEKISNPESSRGHWLAFSSMFSPLSLRFYFKKYTFPENCMCYWMLATHTSHYHSTYSHIPHSDAEDNSFPLVQTSLHCTHISNIALHIDRADDNIILANYSVLGEFGWDT